MRGREREAGGDVVESVLGFIRQQQRRRVDLQRQQVANRVGIFGAIQAMRADASRLRIAIGGGVERGCSHVVIALVSAALGRGRFAGGI